MAVAANAVCGLADCPANSGGACLEGHAEVEECPNFLGSAGVEGDETVVLSEPDDAEHDEETASQVDLPTGAALLPEEANHIIASGRATTVLLAGDAGSG